MTSYRRAIRRLRERAAREEAAHARRMEAQQKKLDEMLEALRLALAARGLSDIEPVSRDYGRVGIAEGPSISMPRAGDYHIEDGE